MIKFLNGKYTRIKYFNYKEKTQNYLKVRGKLHQNFNSRIKCNKIYAISNQMNEY